MLKYMVTTNWIFPGKCEPSSVPSIQFPLARQEDKMWVAEALKETEQGEEIEMWKTKGKQGVISDISYVSNGIVVRFRYKWCLTNTVPKSAEFYL